ncbi:MAG TPA: EamA family transporter [Clostridium sp.]|nr:EamA family transporter [Clostridium sp.]
MKKGRNIKGNMILMLTAFIWGTAFVAQSVGMEYVGPFTFITSRYIIGGIFLVPCIVLLDKFYKDSSKNSAKKNDKNLYIGGFFCGIILFIASSFQQIGMKYTTVGKSGFITALYIIIVPVLGLLFKKKIQNKVWFSVIIALIGFYLLCMKENFEIEKGDFLILMCAISFSIHILVIDKYSPLVDAVRMSCIQFFIAGILGIIPMIIFEKPDITNLLRAYSPILYAGVMSSGVAYTLQIIGQKYTIPVMATLIMSLESVFAALSGWIILGEVLSVKELTGCILVFVGIIIAQLTDRKVS